MTFTRHCLIAVLLLLLPASDSVARDIYVSGRTGDDRSTGHHFKDGGSMDGPVRTIARALELAGPGDRVVLDPKSGPYRESLTLAGRRLSGSAEYPFIIEGCGAVLDGTAPLPPGVWQHYRDDVYRFQLTMQPVNMTCFHILADTKPLKKAVSPSELEPLSWCIFQGFVYFRAEPGKTPLLASNYALSYSKETAGISLVQVSHVRIHDLTLQGYQLDGVAAANGATQVVLDNVACRANGRSGLSIGGASSVHAGYCRFEENHAAQVLSLPYSRGLLYDCGVAEGGILKTSDDSVLVIETASP